MAAMAANDESAKRRRECWHEIIRGVAGITSGILQIANAIAAYYVGERLTIR